MLPSVGSPLAGNTRVSESSFIWDPGPPSLQTQEFHLTMDEEAPLDGAATNRKAGYRTYEVRKGFFE